MKTATLALVGLGLIAGCTRAVTEDAEAADSHLSTASMPTLTIGTEGLYAPYNFCGTPEAPVTCTDASQLQGFDIDVAKAVCSEIGYECKFVLNDWTTMFDNLKADRYKAVFAAVGWKQERTAAGRYTITYEPMEAASQGAHFYAKAANGLTFTPAGLAGKKIGAQTGTLHATHVETNFTQSTLVTFDTQAELQGALLRGDVDAIFVNDDVMVTFLAQNPGFAPSPDGPVVYGEGGFLTGNIYALVSHKLGADPLLYDKINNAILKLHLKGFIKERHAYWVHSH